jgi:CBS domain-containing protein
MINNQIFQDFLQSKSLFSLTNKTKKVFTVNVDNTIEDALYELSSNRVLSVPVLDQGNFTGFLGMEDIVNFYLSKSAASGKSVQLTAKISALNLPPNKALCLPDLCNAVTAVEVFNTGVHRIALIDKNSSINNLFSQSDAVRMLWDGMKNDENLKKAALGITLPAGAVTTCNASDSVWDGLKLLSETGFNALAVIDEDGKLCGNFSIRDFRGLAANHIAALSTTMTIKNYLLSKSPGSLNPIALNEGNNLFLAIQTLIVNAVHGVWLVDADNRPTGRISMTDIMRLVVTAPAVPKALVPRTYPVSLCVEVRGLADLTQKATSLQVALGDEEQDSPAFDVAGNAIILDSPFVANFTITKEMAAKNAKLVFTVFNGTQEIATCSKGVTWVLNGFGTGKTVLALEDNLHLTPSANGAAKKAKTQSSGVIDVALTRSA